MEFNFSFNTNLSMPNQKKLLICTVPDRSTDRSMTDYVYKDEGVVESKTVVYTDGQGTMQFTEDLTFTWQDDKENAGEDMVFKYAS